MPGSQNVPLRTLSEFLRFVGENVGGVGATGIETQKECHGIGHSACCSYSARTALVRLRGWSTSMPLLTAIQQERNCSGMTSQIASRASRHSSTYTVWLASSPTVRENGESERPGPSPVACIRQCG